jgi:hypothetical protein
MVAMSSAGTAVRAPPGSARLRFSNRRSMASPSRRSAAHWSHPSMPSTLVTPSSVTSGGQDVEAVSCRRRGGCVHDGYERCTGSTPRGSPTPVCQGGGTRGQAPPAPTRSHPSRRPRTPRRALRPRPAFPGPPRLPGSPRRDRSTRVPVTAASALRKRQVCVLLYPQPSLLTKFSETSRRGLSSSRVERG